MYKDEVAILVRKVLKGVPQITSVIRNRLHYDEGVELKTYQVRSVLNAMKRDGEIENVPSHYKTQLRWRLL